MNKELKNVLIAMVTLVINVLAPILMVDMYKDYTAKSFIIGTPDKVVKIENLDVNDYVFQENLSIMNFVEAQNENEYIFNYYFDAKDFDSTSNNYLIYINDYMLSITNLEAKSISGQHTRYFKDANHEVCNEVDIEVTFEFYSTYSYLLVKLNTPDITYFNGFRENPGLVLTLSKVNYGMLGNLDDYKEIVTLQQELKSLQATYDELQTAYETLQGKYNQSTSTNEALNAQIATLNSQIESLNSQIVDLQARIDAYDKYGKYEITFKSNDETQEVLLIDNSVKNLSSSQVLSLDNTQSAHFVGWSLDGETVIDPTTVTIEGNTTFIAVWNTIEGTWNFSYGTGQLSHYIDEGEIVIAGGEVEFSSDTFITSYGPSYSGEYIIEYSLAGDCIRFEYDAENDMVLVYGCELDGDFYEEYAVAIGSATRVG